MPIVTILEHDHLYSTDKADAPKHCVVESRRARSFAMVLDDDDYDCVVAEPVDNITSTCYTMNSRASWMSTAAGEDADDSNSDNHNPEASESSGEVNRVRFIDEALGLSLEEVREITPKVSQYGYAAALTAFRRRKRPILADFFDSDEEDLETDIVSAVARRRKAKPFSSLGPLPLR